MSNEEIIKMTHKNVTFPTQLLEELQAEAIRTGEAVNVVIRRACRDYLEVRNGDVNRQRQTNP